MLSSKLSLLAVSSFVIILIGLEIPNSLMFLLGVELTVYLMLIIVAFWEEKRLSLFQIWIAAFVFVILSEMIVISYEEKSLFSYISPIVYLLTANNLVLFGFLTNRKVSIIKHKSYNVTNPSFLNIIIWILVIFYFLSNIYLFQKALYSGTRGGEGTSLGTFDLSSTLSKGIGQILPALIAYYYRYCKKNAIKESFIAVSPVLIIQLLQGSRYSFLFSILPYLLIIGIVNFEKFNFKKLIITTSVLLLIVVVSGLIKQIRSTSLVEYFNETHVSNSGENAPWLVNIAENMSPEGVVEMTALSDDYFSNHEYHYGRESGYIFYFWIPRFIWPSKPTQLDHWLIREYKIVSDNHSSASGFTGELKADFGIFSLFFVFFIGYFLKKLDDYVKMYLTYYDKSFNTVIASSIIPYVFFFVRSPLTSSYSFLFGISLFFFLRKVLCKNITSSDKRSNI